MLNNMEAVRNFNLYFTVTTVANEQLELGILQIMFQILTIVYQKEN